MGFLKFGHLKLLITLTSDYIKHLTQYLLIIPMDYFSVFFEIAKLSGREQIHSFLDLLSNSPCVPGIVTFIYKKIEPLFFKLPWLCLNNLAVDIFN